MSPRWLENHIGCEFMHIKKFKFYIILKYTINDSFHCWKRFNYSVLRILIIQICTCFKELLKMLQYIYINGSLVGYLIIFR